MADKPSKAVIEMVLGVLRANPGGICADEGPEKVPSISQHYLSFTLTKLLQRAMIQAVPDPKGKAQRRMRYFHKDYTPIVAPRPERSKRAMPVPPRIKATFAEMRAVNEGEVAPIVCPPFPEYDPRFTIDPEKFEGGIFTRVGIGRDVNTGRAWE